MMKRVMLIGLCAAVLCACKPMKPTPPKNLSGSQASRPKDETPRALDAGDVEYALRLKATLAEESQAANVVVNEMVNARYEVDMVTAAVASPYPDKLWVSFRTWSTSNFPETPVVVRAKVYKDDQPVQSFTAVFGDKAKTESSTVKFDFAVKDMTAGQSMLVYARAEVFMLPKGTDRAKIDPETVTTDPAFVGHVMSNPVRIDFGSGGQTP